MTEPLIHHPKLFDFFFKTSKTLLFFLKYRHGHNKHRPVRRDSRRPEQEIQLQCRTCCKHSNVPVLIEKPQPDHYFKINLQKRTMLQIKRFFNSGQSGGGSGTGSRNCGNPGSREHCNSFFFTPIFLSNLVVFNSHCHVTNTNQGGVRGFLKGM